MLAFDMKHGNKVALCLHAGTFNKCIYRLVTGRGYLYPLGRWGWRRFVGVKISSAEKSGKAALLMMGSLHRFTEGHSSPLPLRVIPSIMVQQLSALIIAQYVCRLGRVEASWTYGGSCRLFDIG